MDTFIITYFSEYVFHIMLSVILNYMEDLISEAVSWLKYRHNLEFFEECVWI
jgi:hypothetical protein